MSQLGPQETRSDGLSFFVQDQFTFNRLTFNVGLRGEQWKHFASTGDDIFTFDWAVAPRLSAAYDVLGDGRQKVYGYYGRYYDPIRNNMTNFAGTLSGFVREEQVFINNDWVTYRTRGGLGAAGRVLRADDQDALHRRRRPPAIRSDLGRNMSARGDLHQSPDARHPRGLRPRALRVLDRPARPTIPGRSTIRSRCGSASTTSATRENPGSNFVIATLNGGKRNYQGLDLIFRKRYSDNWQLLGSYTYNWAKGNTNSDSNADFQGDVLYLDPLAPNTYQQQPGAHPARLQGGGLVHLADRHRARRRVPLQLGHGRQPDGARLRSATCRFRSPSPYTYAGVTDYWVTADAIGSLQNPSWAQLDLRAQYKQRFAERRHRVLRRHLQRVGQPGLDSRPGSGGRRRAHGVR